MTRRRQIFECNMKVFFKMSKSGTLVQHLWDDVEDAYQATHRFGVFLDSGPNKIQRLELIQ